MEVYKKRKLYDVLMKQLDAPEALVVTGFRRVGKTTLMRQLYDSLPTKNKLFLDLESPVNQQIFENTNYDTISHNFTRLGLNTQQKAYIFLDEIQQVRTLPSVIKYLYDHGDFKFFLTGSSSFYLKNYFSESLAGRKFVFELYPLDFEEFLWFKHSSIGIDGSYDELIQWYREYLEYGGFPSVVLQDSIERKQFALDDILGSYFSLDVKSLSHFRDNDNLKKLLFLLSPRFGSKADVTKLAESLDVSRQTVYDYLSFFEQTYLIHLVRPFSTSTDVQLQQLPKVYCIDTGLLRRIGGIDIGTVFENAVFHQLLMRYSLNSQSNQLSFPLQYYQSKTGAEIDFVVNKHTAFEIKLHATSHDAKKLNKISEKLKVTQHHVISLEKVKKPFDGLHYPFDL